MPTTHTHPPTFAIMTPRSCDRDFGRLFGDRAAELAQAVDADALTAAVESLTTVAISLGTRGVERELGVVGELGQLERLGWDRVAGD